MGSEGLKMVLGQMLVIGNIMNEGSRKGQASGECYAYNAHTLIPKTLLQKVDMKKFMF